MEAPDRSGGLPARLDPVALLSTSTSAVCVVEPDGRLVWANAAAGRVFGGGVPDRLLDAVAREHRGRAEQLLAGAVTDGLAGPAYLRMAHERERWVEVSGTRAGDGLVQLGVSDVTASTQARRALRRSEQRFRAAFEATQSGRALLDANGVILEANAALARLLGQPREQLQGQHGLDLAVPEDATLTRASLQSLRAVGGVVKVPLRLHDQAGQLLHTETTVAVVVTDSGEPGFLVQVEDLTGRRHAEERLRHLALHDALTDLPGRPLLVHRLDQVLQARPRAGLVAVLHVDLAGFQLVNDALGTAAGDAVLVAAAGRLTAAAGGRDLVGRYGGDEFLVVCLGLPDREAAVAVAARVEQALSRPYPFGQDEVMVGATVGVALSQDPEQDAEELVRDAVTATTQAKVRGRRRWEVFDSAMRERATRRSRVEQLLARVLELDGGDPRGSGPALVVSYQPVVDLPTRQVVGVEALMRIRDGAGRLLAPADFLDVAQDGGHLPRLDVLLLEQAAGVVAGLPGDLELAVNCCAGMIGPQLPAAVADALHQSGLPAQRLVLELTEQVLVDSGLRARDALQRVHQMGVRLSIDDFGTGWASLSYLRAFPVSLVKVDRSFVAGLPHERDDLVIVQAVVDLARRLGLACVAEGVENEQQYAALRTMEPPYGQGWLFGRPVLAEALPALLAASPPGRAVTPLRPVVPVGPAVGDRRALPDG